MAERFTYRSRIQATPEEVAAWHRHPLALERLTPPFERVTSISEPAPLAEGLRVAMQMRVGPVKSRFEGEVKHVSSSTFVDEQTRGPFKRWQHTHRFLPDGQGGCVLEEDIDWALPLWPAAAPAVPLVKRRLSRLFRYRHDVAAGDVIAHRGQKRRRIAITGSSGLVGGALVRYLRAGGHEVTALVRPSSRHKDSPLFDRSLVWDPQTGDLDPALSGVDAVVHLAGESVAGRWTDETKARIRKSREVGTRNLAEALAKLPEPPSVLVSASGIGYYGDGGEAVLEEKSSSGHQFLSEVCRAWEAGTQPAAEAGVRVVTLRLGMVLDGVGGALGQMLPPFKAGVGGPLGSGEQWVSWISIDDLLDVIWRGIADGELEGPVNAVSDHPLPQREFARTLGRALRRPAVFTVPAQVLRALFGEMADEAILCSQRVKPAVLLGAGHRFRHPRLEIALRHVLGR